MAEETLYDSEAKRRFAGIELGDDRIPDETTFLNFRHLLERHGLTAVIFADLNAPLADKCITLRSGALMNARTIDAPSSTKSQAKSRDPEMSSIKKGNDWYLGMKAHVAVNLDSSTVHSLEATTAQRLALGALQTGFQVGQIVLVEGLLGTFYQLIRLP